MQFLDTPIVKCKNPIGCTNIYIKREDLLPFSFGGNKVRIANEYFKDMFKKKKNCIIGYGNARSNLCRVLANMSASNQIPCYIVSPSDDDGNRVISANSDLVSLFGAKIRECDKNNVADMVERVIFDCEKMGLNPYYINGDKYGKGNETVPVTAYRNVYNEIKRQSKELGIDFDCIFLATGTGMTQSGLISGQYERKGEEKIIGISIARDSEKEKKIIKNFTEKYIQKQYTDQIFVEDRFLSGGYGKYNKDIEEIINYLIRVNGIPLDPTYTGKAFYGMTEILKENNYKNVLFIHTGGTPLFFDYLNKVKAKK